MSDTKKLSGRCILIAGASSGMGRATAFAAATEGAQLVLLGRDSERLAQVEMEAVKLGAAKVVQICVDASNHDDLFDATETHQELLEKVDTLVNTVGTNLVKRRFMELTPDTWRSMVDSNLSSAFNLSQLVLPIFRSKKNGLIINVSSAAAKSPDLSGAAYQATKAGVLAMTHAIMEEEWHNGVRATVIMPGMTDTPLLNKRPTRPTPEMRFKALQPQDIAETCLFVMSLPARAHVSEIVLQPSLR
ncbi:SDR family oxidoreductase [Leucothrix arctica]|uniref:Short-chain dehydrogenase n=1 Tax=Leucothrix arctica TaxID=1481894 RepID=A0A317CLB6_9GAMM|nr:SDR family oxidoreductase [Leucothrix arctica]PWQ99365.1 hypothetical protein DKT75_01315 [Leucothrix arctica]